MLNTSAGLGDAPVAPRLAFRQRLAVLTLALDVQPPSRFAQALFARAVDVSLVGPDIAAGVAGVEYPLEVGFVQQGPCWASGSRVERVR